MATPSKKTSSVRGAKAAPPRKAAKSLSKSTAKPGKSPPAQKTMAKPSPTPKDTPSRSSALAKVKALPRHSVVASFSTSAGQKLPLRVQTLVDKGDIADILYHGARGLDRMDENILRSIFHADATIDLGPGVFQGAGNDYIHWVLAVLQQVRESHHMIGNILTQMDGDAALVESYCHAHFRLDKPTGREDLFVGSRYLDRMERRPSGPSGVWKIVHRKQIIDWVRTEAASDIFYHQNPDALWSYRTKTDPSYQMAQFPGSQSGNKLPAFLGRRYESRSIKL